MENIPTLEQQIEELEREHAQRERIYPRWINAAKPKLSPNVANQRQARLRAAIETLRAYHVLRTEGICDGQLHLRITDDAHHSIQVALAARDKARRP